MASSSLPMALILVGGLGTRLGALTKNVPKPLLPIRGVPFLERQLRYLKKKGIHQCLLAAGYKSHKILNHFDGLIDDGLPEIKFSLESEPLGTGGAIINALGQINSRELIILNGDTYIDLDFTEIVRYFQAEREKITMAVTKSTNPQRYGTVEITDKRVTKFIAAKTRPEKSPSSSFINAGIYICDVPYLKKLDPGKPFSFEEIVLTRSVEEKNINVFDTTRNFLDIGVPEDYRQAQTRLFLND